MVPVPSLRRGSFRAILAALFFATAFISGPVRAFSYSQVYVFGDSLSDAGNNALVFDSMFGGVLPSTRTRTPIVPGQDLVDSSYIAALPYQGSDRYSNGPVWSEQFLQALGYPAAPSLLGGSIYAFGGARTWTDTTPFTGFPPGVPAQVASYLTANQGAADYGALYILAGGGNDLRDAFATGVGGNPAGAEAIIGSYLDRLVATVSGLYAAGARDFVVWNLPDLGLSPVLSPALALAAHALGADVNARLNSRLDQLQLPGIDLHRFDVFGLVGRIAADPEAYGLAGATAVCAADPVCAGNPAVADTQFFWDGIHITSAGHRLIAQNLLQSIPEPGSLALLGAGLVVLAGRRRRAVAAEPR